MLILTYGTKPKNCFLKGINVPALLHTQNTKSPFMNFNKYTRFENLPQHFLGVGTKTDFFLKFRYCEKE